MLYQSVGSSACAISAVGNLLLLYGIPCSHEDSRALFRSPAIKKRPIVTHPVLLKVVGRCLSQSSLAWRRHSTFSFDRLRHALKQTVSVGAPALLTFHMRHARRDWAGVHCVVVVAVNEAGIHVIDTLGRRDGRWPNDLSKAIATWVESEGCSADCDERARLYTARFASSSEKSARYA
jgi:hypothetical protein